ncbi:uncharacterized protein LOC112684763 [Sipha flava]|uniref:Uncharacterized protein LOC112684763 n=1 Tax=Sipha flava TaxID=143950 RepID=A0A8B8FNG1_9HEMI|nr:uncharacterized protein LOC112684763 [Sipha flava]
MSRFSKINNIISLASTSTGVNSNLTNSESSSNDFDDSDVDCDYIPCQTQENTDSENENSELSYHTLQPVEQVPLINNTVYSEHVVNEPDNIDQVVYDDIPQTTNVEPTKESHYVRKKSKRHYLDSRLSISIMHELYKTLENYYNPYTP